MVIHRNLLGFSIGLVACAIIVAELALIRIFDVLWYTNMSYMVITLAMLAFGSAGVFVGVIGSKRLSDATIPILGLLFALSIFMVQPVIDRVDFKLFATQDIWRAGLHFLIVYLTLSLPFFLGSLILTVVFSNHIDDIRILYGFDLIGASLGCVIILTAVSLVGPGGLLICASAMVLIAICIMIESVKARIILILSSLSLVVWTVVSPDQFEFSAQVNKRNFVNAQASGRHEVGRWDPVSKIDIFHMGQFKWVSYDGGSQSSRYIPFDGDFAKVKTEAEIKFNSHFATPMVLVSHRFKEGSDQKVLVIGAAGGQETKAALTYGASHVDAVEMVGAVVDLAQNEYDDYLGGIYNHPKVNAVKGEGRSFLRSTDTQYDIIQIFSNHTTSSMGSGTGALATTYLQTKQAYKEYITHLSDDGIVHINHHIYPRMLVTAALAWEELGMADFRKHVLVLETQGRRDNLPTFLIKKSPWLADEVAKIKSYLPGVPVVIDPVNPQINYLPDEYFTGYLSQDMLDKALYHAGPTTDDKPYFNYLRKHFKHIEPDQSRYTNLSTTSLLNQQFRNGIPLDSIHLFVTSAAALLFALMFLLALIISHRSSATTNVRPNSRILIYFACLGAGFIILELVFIQLFMKFIGFPAHTYTSVVFGFLLGAGIGSHQSGRYTEKSYVPFLAIILYGLAFILVHQTVFEWFLSFSISIRILLSLIMILPLAYWLGMAFPLGINVFKFSNPNVMPWAWAFNGLFTVAGSIISVVASLYIGFKLTLMIAFVFYVLALVVLRLERSLSKVTKLATQTAT